MNHTHHPLLGDTGKFFFFDENDFNKMVGDTGWNSKSYEVIQRGSKNWTGKVRVWDSSSPYGASGRTDLGDKGYKNAKAGDWAQGDTIQLKACVEAGI